jgi:peptide/nickel transport system permease protein
MLEFMLRRTLVALPVLLLVSLISALIMEMVPGDPAVLIAGQSATDLELAQIREQLGLNRPFLSRLFDWYMALARGDLGDSILLNRPVTRQSQSAFP